VKRWVDWLDERKSERIIQKYILNDKKYAEYFSAVFSFLKAIKTKDDSEKADNLKNAYKFLKRDKKEKEFKTFSKELEAATQFYVGKEDGLSCLKPKNLYEIQDSVPENQYEGKKKIIELDSLRTFKGSLKMVPNTDGYYYAEIIETKMDDAEPLRAYYNHKISRVDIERNEKDNKLYEFKVLIKPDKFYMIYPQKLNW
jgi:hypothetical protein